MTATSEPATASPRVTARRQRRREQILRAALLSFRDRGYHATTLDDIAGRVGIRNTALYHYFPDKEAILFACHQESLAEVEQILEAARLEATPLAALRHAIEAHVQVMTESLQGSPMAFEVTALHPDHQSEVIARRDRYEQGLRHLVMEGINQGQLTPVDPKVAVFAILGAINWVARWYRPGGSTPGTIIGRQFADHLLEGLTCHTPR